MGVFHKDGGYSADLDMFVDIKTNEISPYLYAPIRVPIWEICEDKICFKNSIVLNKDYEAFLCIVIDGTHRWRSIKLLSGAYEKGKPYKYFEP